MLQHSLDASWLAKCCIFPRGTNGFPRCSTFFLASTVMALWMDPMDGWMATLSLQQRWFKSIYQVVRNVQKADLNRVVWWNFYSGNSQLWDFPLLQIPPGSNLRISTLGFSHIESDLLVMGGALRIKKIFIVEINTVENPMVKIPPITSTPQI